MLGRRLPTCIAGVSARNASPNCLNFTLQIVAARYEGLTQYQETLLAGAAGQHRQVGCWGGRKGGLRDGVSGVKRQLVERSV